MNVSVRFDLLSFWHAGTGRGGGADVDAVVARTPGGLPFLPGRTVKGLLRQATELGEACGALAAGTAETWFGTAVEAAAPSTGSGDRGTRVERLEEARYRTRPGMLRVGSALLGRSPDERARWEAWAAAHPNERELLLDRFASTQIGDTGVAEPGTLRAIEVAVPVPLHADVDFPDAPQGWQEQLASVLPLLRGVGSDRHRGLGRVQVSLERS